MSVFPKNVQGLEDALTSLAHSIASPEIRRLEAECDEVREEKRHLQAANREWKESHARLENECDEARQANHRLQEEIDSLTQQLAIFNEMVPSTGEYRGEWVCILKSEHDELKKAKEDLRRFEIAEGYAQPGIPEGYTTVDEASDEDLEAFLESQKPGPLDQIDDLIVSTKEFCGHGEEWERYAKTMARLNFAASERRTRELIQEYHNAEMELYRRTNTPRPPPSGVEL